MFPKSSNCNWLDDRQTVACSACQLSSRRRLRKVHCSNTERNRGTCPATCPPECEPRHFTQSFQLFAVCSSTCTSSRSPKWWEVSSYLECEQGLCISVCTIFLYLYKKSLSKLAGGAMATGLHSQLDVEIEGHEREQQIRRQLLIPSPLMQVKSRMLFSI